MNRTDRLYAIVQQLRAAGSLGRTSTWLADHFEVSTRTIKRDMLALSEAGTALRSDEGRGGGYRLAVDAALPPIAFTAAEATAIAIAIASEPQLPFRSEGRGVLSKLLSSMTSEQRAEAETLAQRVWMRAHRNPLRPNSARVIDEALRTGCVIHLHYVDAKGRETRKRAVEPMVLARTHGHWHLLAWCRLRKGGRWFRLDRIRSARLTRESVSERDLTEVFGSPPDDAHPVSLKG